MRKSSLIKYFRKMLHSLFMIFFVAGCFSCSNAQEKNHEINSPYPQPESMIIHHKKFAQELMTRNLISSEDHSQLLKNINENKLNSILDFLPYCKHAVVIDIKKIEESTTNDSALVGEIVKKISTIHPDLSYSNFQGTFGGFDGYIHYGGFTIEHGNKIYQHYPETADEIPYVFNNWLASDSSEYRLVVLYDYFSPYEPVNVNKDYRKFGVMLMTEAQLEGLYYYSVRSKNFYPFAFPKIMESYEKLTDYPSCIPKSISSGKSYYSIKEALKNPEDVENLYIDSDYLTELGPEIQQFVNLRFLSIEHEGLTSLPSEIGSLTKLERLELSSNKITHLPKEFANLTQLEYLDLGHNQLSSFPKEICSLKNLKYLFLQGNSIDSIPEEIGSLKELCQLNLSNNKLSTLPGSIENFKQLHYLNLSDNKIRQLPKEFYQMTSLRRIILSNNLLEEILPLVGQLRELRELVLIDNQIEELPAEICTLYKLTLLEMYNNKLSSLPACFDRLTSLRYFSIEPNNFSEKEQKRVEIWLKKQEERLFWCRILVKE